MAATVTEKFYSRDYEERVDGGRAFDFVYNIELEEGDNEDTALAGLQTEAPLIVAGASISSWKVRRVGPLLFEGTAHYEVTGEGGTGPGSKLPEAGTVRFNFDTTGATQHITTARKLDTFGAEAPDFGDCLNVERDGSNIQVAGVDIVIPTYKWQETIVVHFTNKADFDTYAGVLKGLTGRVNDATFRDFEAGEVLFLGAQGGGTRRINADASFDAEITYSFGQSTNLTGEEIGDITGIAKRGWEYLWAYFKRGTDGANNLVPKAVGVYIHEPYQVGNFGLLDI